MKKLLGIIVLGLFFISSPAKAGVYGAGELKLGNASVNNFIRYLKGGWGNNPMVFIVTLDGRDSMYWYCPEAQCMSNSKLEIQACENLYNKECKIFARRRTVKWKNGINPAKGKESIVSSKWNDSEIRAKLTALGFLGETTSTTTKIEKKKEETKKTVKKYELKGERSIALSWEGYDDLIAGTVEFDETDYRGTLNLPLPNNDGTCDGTYSLQEGGKGTWQIACTNDMGAAGTLKWKKDGGVTGTGRDHNDKRVKFTVSKNS